MTPEDELLHDFAEWAARATSEGAVDFLESEGWEELKALRERARELGRGAE